MIGNLRYCKKCIRFFFSLTYLLTYLSTFLFVSLIIISLITDWSDWYVMPSHHTCKQDSKKLWVQRGRRGGGGGVTLTHRRFLHFIFSNSKSIIFVLIKYFLSISIKDTLWPREVVPWGRTILPEHKLRHFAYLLCGLWWPSSAFWPLQFFSG